MTSSGGVIPTSLKWLFSWSWHDGRRTQRLELGYRQFSPLVSEIPATFEYIDFEGPPERLQITKIGGYPTGLGSEPSGRAYIISHIMAPFGNGVQAMARSANDSPLNRRCLAPRTPFSGSIRPMGTPAQIDVLRSCVFLRKYCRNLTVSLGGYPRGYITEPQQSSFRPSARRRIHPRIYPGHIPGPIPGPTRRPIPGPGAAPTASTVALARSHASTRGICDPESHNPYTHPHRNHTLHRPGQGFRPGRPTIRAAIDPLPLPAIPVHGRDGSRISTAEVWAILGLVAPSATTRGGWA